MPVMPERRAGLEAAADASELGVRNARFTALFRAEYGYVWGTLRRFGVNDRDAEDVAHEVFMRIYDKLEVLDPSRPARPWVFSFVYRAACDYRKLARHRLEVLEERDAASEMRSAERTLEHVDDARLVSAALECLEFERRTVLIAFEMDDVPMKTIAEATGVPLFTAYSRLRLAREDFRAAVERLRRKGGTT
ncbi:MAG: polymerase sigma factor RpoE [Myxococcaceae bacterium]|nr:polymerase sigma factor RpoE [Myxococcaceae bacterium]